MKSLTIILASAAILFLSASVFADDDRRGRRGPPEAAFTACEGLAAEAVCTVTKRNGDVANGTCLTPARLDRAVCVPDDHQKRERKHREQGSEDSDTL